VIEGNYFQQYVYGSDKLVALHYQLDHYGHTYLSYTSTIMENWWPADYNSANLITAYKYYTYSIIRWKTSNFRSGGAGSTTIEFNSDGNLASLIFLAAR